MSVQQYVCTTGTLTNRLKKKLDGNYTKILRVVLNKCSKAKYKEMCGFLPLISPNIQERPQNRKDKQDMLETAGEVSTNSFVILSNGRMGTSVIADKQNLHASTADTRCRLEDLYTKSDG